jgi:hypothetical protein
VGHSKDILNKAVHQALNKAYVGKPVTWTTVDPLVHKENNKNSIRPNSVRCFHKSKSYDAVGKPKCDDCNGEGVLPIPFTEFWGRDHEDLQ